MSLLTILRRHRRAVLVPVVTWLLLQVVLATGVRAGMGMPAGDPGSEARLLRDLATSLCLPGQSADGEQPLSSLHDRCSWCAAFGSPALPAAAAALLIAALPLAAAPLPVPQTAPQQPPPRFALFVTRAPPA